MLAIVRSGVREGQSGKGAEEQRGMRKLSAPPPVFLRNAESGALAMGKRLAVSAMYTSVYCNEAKRKWAQTFSTSSVALVKAQCEQKVLAGKELGPCLSPAMENGC